MKLHKNACSSCLMPFAMDPLGDKRESREYCSLCYKDGSLCYTGDLKGFQAIVYPAMIKKGIPSWKAKIFTWLIRFAPRWKRK